MSPHAPTLGVLAVLCLGHMISTEEGVLPTPSIRAEPSSVIPRGRPVTIVCRGPPDFDTFRLEKKGSSSYTDVRNTRPPKAEARFPIPSVNEDAAGHYHCVYAKGAAWSSHSKTLELVVINTPDLLTEHLHIVIGVSVASLFCLLLLLLLLFCFCSQRQKKQGPLSGKSQQQSPQESLSPANDGLKRTPEMATADRLSEKDRERDSLTPAAGVPQEVTYAQLDHRALTQRAAQAEPPQYPEPTAESSTYAALARH